MFELKLPHILKKITSSSRGESNAEKEPCIPSMPSTPCSFEQADMAVSNYGLAAVKISNSPMEEKVSTPQQVERILKNFLNNDDYEISTYSELFSNLDKLDYTNIDRHLRNIKIFLGMTSNFPENIVKNGYFYSEDGAIAFELLSGILSNKSESGYVTPLSIALSNYNPKTVLTLEKRGLLSAKGIDNYRRLHKLANMSEEQYESFQKRVDDSINATGKSFEELSEDLLIRTKPLMSEHSHKFLEKNYVNKESVVAQLELLDVAKNFPVDFENYELLSLLGEVDIDNISSYKKILSVLEQCQEINSSSVNSVLDITNKNTEDILSNLLLMENIPISKIVEYCRRDENFKKGLVSFETILERINNDPYLRTVRSIENSNVNLTPQNTTPTALNPHNIDTSALALVHMTDYEIEDGMILSTRDKLQGSRNSVHFTLNHPVSSHHFGDWEQKKYAIIMPYETTVNSNENGKFIEGMPNDLYTNGSVKVPEGSVIIKYNPDIPEGETIITNSSQLKGVKLIESSEYPHKLVPSVIKKMGYSHLQADGPIGLFSFGKNNGNDVDVALENYSAWKEFCDSHCIKATRHTGSAGDIAESVVENVGKLCVKNSWFGGRENTKNYKEELLYYLEEIKPWQNMGYFVSYDLDTMIKIIQDSPTPKEAVEKMKEKFGFHPTLEYERFNECMFSIPIELYSTWHDMSDNLSNLRGHIIEEMN